MIDVLTNSFLSNPVPLQLTLNYCSHGCSYCFANMNNPTRKADLKGILSMLKNHKNRTDLVSYYLKEKYPLLISNNIDPFSKNNYELSNQIIDVLLDLNIPIQLNTRGGYGWEQTITKINPGLFIVSVPFSDDNERKRLEPNAPDLNHRFEFVSEVIKNGHKVIIGINPFNHTFCKDHTEIIDKYREIGVKYFWVNKLHLTYKQQANLTENQKSAIGTDVLKQAGKIKEFEQIWLNQFIKLREYAISVNCEIVGTPSGYYEPYIDEMWGIYDKKLPTQNTFFKWCEENKTDGDLITFEEFYSVLQPLIPNIECDISKYIYNKSILDDKTYMRKTKLSNLLHVYFDSKAGLNIPKYYPIFSWVKEQTKTKLDWIKDKNGDRVMLYHPNNYNTKEFIILK